MKKYQNCLVIGKFMPPHKGHEYMIRFAQEYAQNVHVVVDCLSSQTISPEQRKQWLEKQIANINVYALKKFMPQDPSETPEFWNIWKNSLYETLNGVKPDLVVAGMDYGWELAKTMNCDFIPVDMGRESIPISATMLRNNIYKHWDYLMDSVKGDYVKKICLLGPESTGKSTIGQKIANTINTVYIPEYAKTIIEKQKGQFFKHNVQEVALAQINSEKALAKFSNKSMICDSSALTTLLYSRILFNDNSLYLNNLVNNHRYDLYCLFFPDTEFVDDIHRKVLDNPQAQRIKMFQDFKDELEKHQLPFVILTGNYETKEKQLLSYINELFTNCEIQ